MISSNKPCSCIHNLLEQIKTLISVANSRLEGTQYENAQQLFLIGKSGAGKSTLFSGLRNDELIVKKNDLLTIITEVEKLNNEQQEEPLIGVNAQSTTKQINTFLLKSQHKKIVIIDLPGFSDTGSISIDDATADDSGHQNIRNSALIKHAFDRCKNVSLCIVVEFNEYLIPRPEKNSDSISMVLNMIPDLIDHIDSIGIVINQVDLRYKENAVLNEITKYYQKTNNEKGLTIFQQVIQRNHLVIVHYPKEELIDERLPQNYFSEVENMLFKLKSSTFQQTRAALYNPKSSSLIDELAVNFGESFKMKIALQGDFFTIPYLNENEIEQPNLQEIERLSTEWFKNLNQLNKFVDAQNQNNESLSAFVLNVADFLVCIGQQSNAENTKAYVTELKSLSTVCELPSKVAANVTSNIYFYLTGNHKKYQGNFKSEFLQDVYESLHFQIEKYLRTSTQMVLEIKQKKESNKMQLHQPQFKTLHNLLVARRVAEKSEFEEQFDEMATGNERFEEVYFCVQKRSSGKPYIVEITHINEKMCPKKCFELFDIREKMIKHLELSKLFYELNSQENKNNHLIQQMLIQQVKLVAQIGNNFNGHDALQQTYEPKSPIFGIYGHILGIPKAFYQTQWNHKIQYITEFSQGNISLDQIKNMQYEELFGRLQKYYIQ